LYCCTDYQEYVESILEYQADKDKLQEEQENKIEIMLKNKKARRLAKERAEIRKMQKIIEKQKEAERKKIEKEKEMLQQKKLREPPDTNLAKNQKQKNDKAGSTTDPADPASQTADLQNINGKKESKFFILFLSTKKCNIT
jgi:UDP-N-acetylmuramoylalanine-D-glutamate ligase